MGPQAPERILDAPELLDDYYLNLLDWGCNNVVAVALGPTVYLWNAGSGDIQQLCQTREDTDDCITSISWAADGKHIAVGTNNAEVQIWDAARSKQVRTLRGHSARVGCLAWNGTTLATGGRDGDQVVGLDLEHEAVEVGQLVALRVDREVVRVAHENLRPAGFPRAVHPRPEIGRAHV